jgi:hypothetical protein
VNLDDLVDQSASLANELGIFVELAKRGRLHMQGYQGAALTANVATVIAQLCIIRAALVPMSEAALRKAIPRKTRNKRSAKRTRRG